MSDIGRRPSHRIRLPASNVVASVSIASQRIGFLTLLRLSDVLVDPERHTADDEPRRRALAPPGLAGWGGLSWRNFDPKSVTAKFATYSQRSSEVTTARI